MTQTTNPFVTTTQVAAPARRTNTIMAVHAHQDATPGWRRGGNQRCSIMN